MQGRLTAAGHLGWSKGLRGAGAPLLRTGVGRVRPALGRELVGRRARYRYRPEAGRRQAAKVLATGQWSAPEGRDGVG